AVPDRRLTKGVGVRIERGVDAVRDPVPVLYVVAPKPTSARPSQCMYVYAEVVTSSFEMPQVIVKSSRHEIGATVRLFYLRAHAEDPAEARLRAGDVCQLATETIDEIEDRFEATPGCGAARRDLAIVGFDVEDQRNRDPALSVHAYRLSHTCSVQA